MASSIQQGYLLLADISGYTSYLTSTEIEHSQSILEDLIGTIITAVTPTFEVAEIEGDAVFAYGPKPGITHTESILETIEAAYGSFLRRRDSIKLSTTCQCDACRKIPTLDLKFVTHYGEYTLQEFSGQKKPFGADVTLAHRLLKNSVSEKTGLRGYALFSQQTADKLSLCAGDDVKELREEYEHIGEVPTLYMPLSKVYAHFKQANRIRLTPEESDVVLTKEFPFPPSVVWEWAIEPEKRSQWMEGVVWSKGVRSKNGRVDIGSTNHCAHGKGVTIETIVDWQPFEYFTSEQTNGKMRQLMTVNLEPTATGTSYKVLFRVFMPLPGFIRKPLIGFMMKKVYKLPNGLDKIGKLIAENAIAGL